MSEAAEKPGSVSSGLLKDLDPARMRFRADYLHALAPIIRAGQRRPERHAVSGLFLEPLADGGVLLVATDGRRLAILHEREAKVTRAMRITIPDDFLRRAAPIKGCEMWSEGESFFQPAPEWMEPGEVWGFALALFLHPKMHIPGDDPRHSPVLAHAEAEEGKTHSGGYRLHPDIPDFPWRRVFSRQRGQAEGRVVVHPKEISGFARIDKLMGGRGMALSFAAPDQAVILTVPDRPEFLGAIMPCSTPMEHLSLPGWAIG